MAEKDSSGTTSFFRTLPGILTGLAALLTAVTGLYIAVRDTRPNETSNNELVELSIDSFSLDPMPPTQNKPVVATASVRNSGTAAAEDILIKWWPGVNFPDPLTKTVPQIRGGEVKEVAFNYPGYKSWYGQIETKFTVNPNKTITERDYNNNTLNKKISVRKDKN